MKNNDVGDVFKTERIKFLISDFEKKERFVIPQCTVRGISGLSHLFIISRAIEDFILSPQKKSNYGKDGETTINEILEALEKEKKNGYQNMKKLLITKLQKN